MGSVTLHHPTETGGRAVSIDDVFLKEVAILKQLTWEYVIDAPALATQQYGQRKVIEDLFDILTDAASRNDFGVFPPRFAEGLEDILVENGELSDREITRTVSDYISGMTEREAVELHRRLSGASLGSVLDPFAP